MVTLDNSRRILDKEVNNAVTSTYTNTSDAIRWPWIVFNNNHFRLYPSLIGLLLPISAASFINVFVRKEFSLWSSLPLLCILLSLFILLITLPKIQFSSEGYTIHRFLQKPLFVLWSEVQNIIQLEDNSAIIVQCTNTQKNLIIPNNFSYGYFFFYREKMISYIHKYLQLRNS